MGLKKWRETVKWQHSIMRDPCDPVRDFKERMAALFSGDDDKPGDDKYSGGSIFEIVEYKGKDDEK